MKSFPVLRLAKHRASAVSREVTPQSEAPRLRAWFPALCALLSALIPPVGLAADKKKPAADKKAEAAPSYLLYANTVTDRGWSFFMIDGQDINPAGIKSGFRSSWVIYPAGPRQLQFEHQPLGLVDLETDLQPGALHAFIVYSDTVPQTNRGRPPRPVLRVKELRCDLASPPEARKGNRLVLLNLTTAPSLRVRVNDQTLELPRLQETLVKVPKRGNALEISVLPGPGLLSTSTDPAAESVPVSEEDVRMHSQRLNFEDPGARFLVFYSGVQNDVQSLIFDDIGMYPEGEQ